MANAALRARDDAEYRALQAQIQPHFLYNVLNGLVALTRMGERAALESSLHALKDMLRYTVEHGQLATVGEEFSFLERYCRLQKLRFEERFDYEIRPRARGLASAHPEAARPAHPRERPHPRHRALDQALPRRRVG